jgi:hypothetical protein
VACAAPRFLLSSPPHPRPAAATVRRCAITGNSEAHAPGAVATREGASIRAETTIANIMPNRARCTHFLDGTHDRLVAGGRYHPSTDDRVRRVRSDNALDSRERVIDVAIAGAYAFATSDSDVPSGSTERQHRTTVNEWTAPRHITGTSAPVPDRQGRGHSVSPASLMRLTARNRRCRAAPVLGIARQPCSC